MQVATNGNIKQTDEIKAPPNRFIISYMQPEFHNLLLKIFVWVFYSYHCQMHRKNLSTEVFTQSLTRAGRQADKKGLLKN